MKHTTTLGATIPAAVMLSFGAWFGIGAQECRASERSVGHLLFENTYRNASAKVTLYHRNSPNRVWRGASWNIPRKKRGPILHNGKAIKVRGDWWVQIKVASATRSQTSKKYRISSVGVHGSDGNWHISAKKVLEGKPPAVRLPISASRGSARWTINAKGVVTSYIKYTVGSGSGSKKYSTGLIVEYADGKVDTAWATKTVGRPAFGTKKGTATNASHNALNVRKLNNIRRVYVKYDTNSSGPNTIREWITKVRKWAKEGEEIYKELKDNDLVKDAVTFAGS